jgi:integrase
MTSEIGPEMGMNFPTYLLKFEAHLLKKYKKKTTVGPKKSLIKKINQAYRQYLNTLGLPPNFSGALRHLLDRDGLTCFELSKKANILNQKLSNWVNGTTVPNHQSLSCIQKLERFFDLPTNALAHHAVSSTAGRIKEKRQNKTRFGKKNAKLTRLQYRYATLPAQVENEWQKFVEFKTSAYLLSGMKRKTTWRDKKGGSTSVYYEMLRSFFGYLVLKPGNDPNMSGKGLSEEDISYAMLTDSSLVLEYIEFRKARSGRYTNETLNFLNFCKSCLQPKWGYLWQNDDLGIDLALSPARDYYGIIFKAVCDHLSSDKERSESLDAIQSIDGDYTRKNRFKEIWGVWCEFNKNQILNVANELEHNNHIKQGRDVTEPIADILARPHPISALNEMAANIERELPHPSQKTKFAVAYRNLLVVKILISNPLRRIHFSKMTWTKQNTGNLYQTPNGEWRLRFKSSDFKNERGAASSDYDVPMLGSLKPHIETYLFTCRKELLGHDECDFVFRPKTTQKGKLSPAEPMKVNTLTELMRTQITPAFSPGSYGFAFHSFRHIIATDYLRNNPNGFQIVADILHDKLNTVLNNYAHLKVADGLRFYHEYLENSVD